MDLIVNAFTKIFLGRCSKKYGKSHHNCWLPSNYCLSHHRQSDVMFKLLTLKKKSTFLYWNYFLNTNILEHGHWGSWNLFYIFSNHVHTFLMPSLSIIDESYRGKKLCQYWFWQYLFRGKNLYLVNLNFTSFFQ